MTSIGNDTKKVILWCCTVKYANIAKMCTPQSANIFKMTNVILQNHDWVHLFKYPY